MQPRPGCARCLARGLFLLELATRWLEGATVGPALPRDLRSSWRTGSRQETLSGQRQVPALRDLGGGQRTPVLRQREWKVHEDNDCGPWTEGVSGETVDILPGDPGRKPAGPVPPAVSLAHLATRLRQAPTSSSRRSSCSRPPGPALPPTHHVGLEEPPSAPVSRSRMVTPVPPPPRAASHVSEIIKVKVCENS